MKKQFLKIYMLAATIHCAAYIGCAESRGRFASCACVGRQAHGGSGVASTAVAARCFPARIPYAPLGSRGIGKGRFF